mgnify:CR=1 FL=1
MTQRGSVTVVSPGGIETYRLDGVACVSSVRDAVSKFLGENFGDFNGLIQLNSAQPVYLKIVGPEVLRPGDVIVILEGQIASGGFKAAFKAA